MASDGIGIST